MSIFSKCMNAERKKDPSYKAHRKADSKCTCIAYKKGEIPLSPFEVRVNRCAGYAGKFGKTMHKKFSHKKSFVR